MHKWDSPTWDFRIRAAFWIMGICCGGITAYTTRFFINGDAIAYIEMGEALRLGHPWGLANLTYSPGYPILLGIAQALLHTSPLNELQLLRIANFVCLLLAMATCEVLMIFLHRAYCVPDSRNENPLPFPVVRALACSMFLVSSLVFIRIRLLNPDMLVFALVLAVTSALLWIRENPQSYFRHLLLGICAGLGYITKSFFLPFSLVFFALSAICSDSFRRAIPRVIVAIIGLLIVAAPLVSALSLRLGRFSYGELGPHVYATFISGRGESKTQEILNSYPKVVRFRFDIPCTRPSGFDICYWHIGVEPVFDLRAQLSVIPNNVLQIFKDTPWLILILIWYVMIGRLGKVRIGPFLPPSLFILFIVPSLFGIGLYCLTMMETRYIAPSLFLGFMGLTVSLRLPGHTDKTYRKVCWFSAALITFFLVMVFHSFVDQSVRGLISRGNQLSYRDSFNEELATKDFLLQQGIEQGDATGVVGSPPVYWARMAGTRITLEITSAEDFINSSKEERNRSLNVLRASGIRAIVGKGGVFGGLYSEGWQPVPGTRDYFVNFLRAQ